MLSNINFTKLSSNKPIQQMTWSEGADKNHSFQWTVIFSPHMCDMLLDSAALPVVLEQFCHCGVV